METLGQEKSLWQSLTLEQQNGVLLAYEDSEYEENLISIEEIKSKFTK